MSIWSKYYWRWKSRFLGVMNTLIIMRITNDGKDNVPSKGLTILSRIKSFKDIWFWNITEWRFKARFRRRCHNKEIVVECDRSQWCGTTVGCCMTRLMADENFQTKWWRIKKPCGFDHFSLNLVKLALQTGNQLGSLLVTLSQLCKIYFHKTSLKQGHTIKNHIIIQSLQFQTKQSQTRPHR